MMALNLTDLNENDYVNKLLDWFGPYSSKVEVLQYWGSDEAYYVLKYENKIQFYRLFDIGGKVQISQDGEYKL